MVRLKAAIAQRRGELALLLADGHDLSHTVRYNLLALYQTKLGAWELELMRSQVRVARLKRIMELAQAALNRGVVPNLLQIEAQVREEQVLWEAKLREAVAKLRQAEERLTNLLSHEENVELKKLYHQLVKRLHPDLHPDQTEGDRSMWRQVQEAYDVADVERLRALSLVMTDSPLTDTPHAFDKLKAEHDLLIKRIAEQEHKINALKSQPPFNLRENLEDDNWVSTKRTTLEKETEELQAQAATLEKHLEQLIPSYVPRIEFGPN